MISKLVTFQPPLKMDFINIKHLKNKINAVN